MILAFGLKTIRTYAQSSTNIMAALSNGAMSLKGRDAHDPAWLAKMKQVPIGGHSAYLINSYAGI